jgi:hypothetical protein
VALRTKVDQEADESRKAIPGGADGDRGIGETLRILVGQAATTVPPSELLLDDLFDVLRRSCVAQPRQDRREFGHELLGTGPVDPDRVELEQDLGAVIPSGLGHDLADALYAAYSMALLDLVPTKRCGVLVSVRRQDAAPLRP